MDKTYGQCIIKIPELKQAEAFRQDYHVYIYNCFNNNLKSLTLIKTLMTNVSQNLPELKVEARR